MSPWAAPLAAARARIAAEDSLHRRVRLGVRALWDAAVQLEAASSPVPDPTSLAALRREALRLAAQALPFPALADTADARRQLSLLVEQGLDGVSPGEVDPLLEVAREAHARALAALEVDHAQERELVRRDQVSFGLLVVAACALLALLLHWMVRPSPPVDLAAGKPTSQSSKWADCHPEQNECGGLPMRIAFCTVQENSPWYQVDLGAPTSFSAATIVNRQDMAMMRALPLVIEASDDGRAFREVTRRTEKFSVWHATFPPQTARYFRVRVDRNSILHLEAVRVHP